MLTRTFFARAPFTAPRFAPLPAGAVSARGAMRDRLLSLRAGLLSRAVSAFPRDAAQSGWTGADAPADPALPGALEAALLCAAQLGDDELRREALRVCELVAAGQREDGAFASPQTSFAARGRMLRAMTFAYALTGERSLLTFMLRYMKYLLEALKKSPLSEEDAMHIADTLEAGITLYNVTGQRAIVPVLNLLISQGMDYTSLFHAFPYRAPISRSHPEAAAAHEDGESDYVAHLRRTADGANLCEGLRASALCGVVTGSGKHLSAPEVGLARLNRAHGAVCGGVTADPMLAGAHPSRGVRAASMAELAVSLETLLSCPGGEHGADQLETLLYNGVAAAFSPDVHAAQGAQQANQIAIDRAERYPLLGGEAGLFTCDGEAASQLLSAWPRFVQHQWMLTRDDGLCAMGYAPCSVRYRLGGVGVRALVEGDYPASGSVRITLHVERETAFPLVLRIPAWAKGASVAVGGEIVPAEAGSFLTLNRQWCDGDSLLLTLPMAAEAAPCFHQAVFVRRGPLRFAYAPEATSQTEPDGTVLSRAEGAFGVALLQDAPIESREKDGRVTLTAQAVPMRAWGLRGPDADQPPIEAQREGEPFEITLVPYAEAAIRLAVLPTVR